jgi:hypothetical protein
MFSIFLILYLYNSVCPGLYAMYSVQYVLSTSIMCLSSLSSSSLSFTRTSALVSSEKCKEKRRHYKSLTELFEILCVPVLIFNALHMYRNPFRLT